MRGARFLEEASQEFLAQVAYYEELELGLGLRFQVAVQSVLAMACANPGLGSPWKSRTRRVFPKGFPFSLIYRVEATEIVVFAVSHFRQHPGHWRKRRKPESKP